MSDTFQSYLKTLMPSTRQSNDIDWVHGTRNKNASISCLQEIHFCFKDKHHLGVKRWTKILQSNGTRKQAGIANLASDFKLK